MRDIFILIDENFRDNFSELTKVVYVVLLAFIRIEYIC